MFYTLLFLLPLFSKVHAVDTGLSYEIKRFKQDVLSAGPVLEDALTKMKADFADNLTTLNTTGDGYLWTDESSMSAATSSIAEIRSGWVYGTDTLTENSGKFKELPDTAFGTSGSVLQTFIVQITFQNSIDISPILRDRTVTFVSYGLGPDHHDITSSAATATLPLSATDMSSIAGFRCFLKANTSGDKPGYVYLDDSDSVNLWNFTDGSLSKCKYA